MEYSGKLPESRVQLTFPPLDRGALTQRPMGPDMVVVVPPVLDDLSCLGQAAEPVLPQALVAELAVE